LNDAVTQPGGNGQMAADYIFGDGQKYGDVKPEMGHERIT